AKTEALAGCVDRHRSPERAAGHRFDRRRGDRIHLPGPRGDGLANSLERIENAMTGFSSSPLFVQHDTGPHHPERPDRIRAIHRAVREAGLIDSPDPFPDFELDLGAIDGAGVKLVELTPAYAEHKWVLSVHSEHYFHNIHHVCELGGGIL